MLGRTFQSVMFYIHLRQVSLKMLNFLSQTSAFYSFLVWLGFKFFLLAICDSIFPHVGTRNSSENHFKGHSADHLLPLADTGAIQLLLGR